MNLIERIHFKDFEWVVVSPGGQEVWYKVRLNKKSVGADNWEYMLENRPKDADMPTVVDDTNINQFKKPQ